MPERQKANRAGHPATELCPRSWGRRRGEASHAWGTSYCPSLPLWTPQAHHSRHRAPSAANKTSHQLPQRSHGHVNHTSETARGPGSHFGIAENPRLLGKGLVTPGKGNELQLLAGKGLGGSRRPSSLPRPAFQHSARGRLQARSSDQTSEAQTAWASPGEAGGRLTRRRLSPNGLRALLAGTGEGAEWPHEGFSARIDGFKPKKCRCSQKSHPSPSPEAWQASRSLPKPAAAEDAIPRRGLLLAVPVQRRPEVKSWTHNGGTQPGEARPYRTCARLLKGAEASPTQVPGRLSL